MPIAVGVSFLEVLIFERHSKRTAPVYAIRFEGAKGWRLSLKETFMCLYVAKNQWMQGMASAVIGDVNF